MLVAKQRKMTKIYFYSVSLRKATPKIGFVLSAGWLSRSAAGTIPNPLIFASICNDESIKG